MRELKIGRNQECDIVINDQTVSKMHATLIIRDDGYYVKDNDSTNGTFINGTKISGIYPLKENDILKVGNTVVPWRNHIIQVKIPPVSPRPAQPANNTSTTLPPTTKKKKNKTTLLLVSGGIILLLAVLILYFFIISQKDGLRISAEWSCDKNCGTINTIIFSNNENNRGSYTYITKNTIVDTTRGTYYINAEDNLLRLSVGLLEASDSIGSSKTDVLYKYQFKRNNLSLSLWENSITIGDPIVLIKKR
jgi:flagellar basal body-associated protein FliL